MRRELFVGMAVLLCVCASWIPAASAVALPPFDGVMAFPNIEGPSGPEEYSWEVTLGEGQALRQLGERHAEVYYVEDDHKAFDIEAGHAHDVVGSTVPTSLSVSAPHVITLTVHHLDGNPLAGGAPFTYPVLPGAGWIGIDEGGIVPPPIEIAQDIHTRNEWADPSAQIAAPLRCQVQKLHRRSLRASKQRLRKANCKVGWIHKRGSVASRLSRVVAQSPRPGTLLAHGAAVNLTLDD